MILIKISMFVIFSCIFFLLVYRRIQVNTWARAWSCFTLLGIVGIAFDPKYTNIANLLGQLDSDIPAYMGWLAGDVPNILFWVGLAGMLIYITVKAYRRGYI